MASANYRTTSLSVMRLHSFLQLGCFVLASVFLSCTSKSERRIYRDFDLFSLSGHKETDRYHYPHVQVFGSRQNIDSIVASWSFFRNVTIRLRHKDEIYYTFDSLNDLMPGENDRRSFFFQDTVLTYFFDYDSAARFSVSNVLVQSKISDSLYTENQYEFLKLIPLGYRNDLDPLSFWKFRNRPIWKATTRIRSDSVIYTGFGVDKRIGSSLKVATSLRSFFWFDYFKSEMREPDSDFRN